MLITLTNDFHNTETNIRVGNDGVVSHQAGQRAWKNLCGQKGCICGGVLGQRGRQVHKGSEVQIEQNDWHQKSARIEIRTDL